MPEQDSGAGRPAHGWALDLVRIDRAAVGDEAAAPGVAYVAHAAGCPRGLVLIRDLQALLAAGEGPQP